MSDRMNHFRRIIEQLAQNSRPMLVRTDCGLSYLGVLDISEDDRVEITTADTVVDVGLDEITGLTGESHSGREEEVYGGRVIVREGNRITHGPRVGDSKMFSRDQGDQPGDFAGTYRVTAAAGAVSGFAGFGRTDWLILQGLKVPIRNRSTGEEAEARVDRVHILGEENAEEVFVTLQVPFAFEMIPTNLTSLIDGSPVLSAMSTFGGSGDDRTVRLRRLTLEPIR